jgi:Ca-activated chloride channel family protein
MSPADSKLDAQLRNVPLPDGLLDRLMALPLAGDDCLDELVRDVAIPPNLLSWLQAIPLTDDEGLDEALRNVPVPPDLVTSCHYPGRRFAARLKGRRIDRVFRLSRFAMAASLILAISLSLGSAMLIKLVVDSFSGPQPGTFVKREPVPPAPMKESLEASWGMIAGDGNGDLGQTPQAIDARREIALAELPPAAVVESRDQIASAMLPRGADPRQLPDAMGSHNNWDTQSDLPTRVANLVPHGLDWPIVPGDNRQFLQRTGFHPFVSPSENQRLQSCPVPLAVEPLSYELARRYAERNELPPEKRVRTEEFLSAVDYNFSRPHRESLGLIAAGGPSPISGEGYCLLQIGVQARQTDSAHHSAKHLVFLIDTSTSMCWGSRMEIVRHALGDLSAIVGPEDRLSLVTFNQAAHVLVEDSNRDAMPQFLAAVNSLSADGATNIVGGLREAYGVARQTLGTGQPAARVVLLTDGLLDLEAETARTIQQQVAEAADQKIPLDVIDLGQQKETDPQVAAIAQAGGGTIHRAISNEQVRWALREIVTGRSQLVARAARLQVTFNPKAVLEYRLVGHESVDWDGLLPGPLEADFHEGQAATALFEVRIAPDGPHDVASAELTWYSPDGEKTLAGKVMQRSRLMVDRRQFAGSLTSSAPSLQEAAVVAYTAEVLRRSPFIFQRHAGLTMPAALFRAVELSGQIDSQLQLRPSFDQFVALIRQEMKAHPVKRSAKD